jgi:hypothetical protein
VWPKLLGWQILLLWLPIFLKKQSDTFFWILCFIFWYLCYFGDLKNENINLVASYRTFLNTEPEQSFATWTTNTLKQVEETNWTCTNTRLFFWSNFFSFNI